MLKSTIIYDLGHNARFLHSVFSASEMENSAENLPGWYAWHIRLPRTSDRVNDTKRYAELFALKELGIRASAPLGEQYAGKIKRDTDSTNFASHNNNLEALTAIFAPPIYIGISVDVKRRLTQHLQSLDSILSGVSDDVWVDNGQEVADDTEEETRMFAQRIGIFLRNRSIMNTNALFIKVFYQAISDPKELTANEGFLNHTFLPICGRR